MEDRLRRIFWILITPTVIFILLATAFNYFLWPRISNLIKSEIQRITENETDIPVVVKVTDVELRWLRPSLVLNKVNVVPKKDFEKILTSTDVDEVRIQVDPFQIILGRLTLSALTIEGVKSDLNIDPLLDGPSQAHELPLDKMFKQLSQVPIDRLFLERINLNLISKNFGGQLALKDSNFGLLIQNKKLQLRTSIKEAEMDYKKYGKGKLGIETLLQLTPRTLKILQLQTSLNKNSINIEGQLDNFHRVQLHPKGNLNIKTNIDLLDLIDQIKNINPNWKLPPIAGVVQSNGQIKIDSLDDLTGQFQFYTRDVKVQEFEIGNAQLIGEFKNKSLSINKIEALHPAGKLTLKKTDLELTQAFKFSTDVETDNLDLQKLFQSLKLKKVPVELLLQVHLPCSGQLSPFVANCEGSVTGKNLHVNGKPNFTGKPIIKVDEIQGKGSVQIDLKQVKYSAAVKIANNEGQTDGVIVYDEGFKINYKTPELSFDNLKSLADLNIHGLTSIEGSTEGNSEAATFNMKLNARTFEFENYQLGNFTTVLSYADGHLYFKDIEGLMSRSSFQGQLDIHLREDQIMGQLDFPRTDLSDIAWIFDHVYQFPVAVRGAGQARMRFEGPLNFWKLNYKLESHFQNGLIGTESFTKANFNVNAIDGNIKSDLVELYKNNSTFKINGQISSAQKLKLTGVGERLKLDESELINGINKNIFGFLNVKAELTGSIPEPKLNLVGNITETVLEEQEVPDSQFKIAIDRQSLSVKSQLFGDKISGDILWPFKVGNSPLKIDIKTEDWNFTQILALFDASFLQNEYQSQLTSDINIISETGDPYKASGKIKLNNIFLKRGPLVLQNSGPVEVLANNGKLNLKNFNLQGQDNFIQLTGNDFTLNQLDMQLKGSVELRLMHMFLPFLEDLGGPAKGTASITGTILKPQLLGNAELNGAFVKLKGFPHPMDNINSDILFSHSKVLIQNIKAQLAGGAITGSGEIQIQGWRDFPANIKIKAEGVNLLIPEKVKSSGNAELNFTGNWFPFLLSGTYNVTSALFEKEFSDDANTFGTTRQSNYLPKVLKENSFDPVMLDIQIVLQRSAEVKNSQVDGTVNGQLQVKGSPDKLVILGKSTIEKNTKLVFRDKIFELQTGSVNFNNQAEINPELYIAAQARVDEYDVNLLIQGLAKSPSIRLSSLPPLPESEIISLLALGVTSQRLEKNLQSKDQAEKAALDVGGSLISSKINRTLQDSLGVVLQISSVYDTTKNISVPKAILTKKINKKLEASVSRAASTTDAKLQYLINQNLSTNLSGEFREADTGTQRETESILGLDLVYKKGFK